MDKFDLKPVTWDHIRKNNIKEVFIKATEASELYGPYLVVDGAAQLISKLDGTKVRSYPRDKGLFVKKTTGVVVELSTNIILELEKRMNAVTVQIEQKELEVDELYKEYSLLNEILDQAYANM